MSATIRLLAARLTAVELPIRALLVIAAIAFERLVLVALGMAALAVVGRNLTHRPPRFVYQLLLVDPNPDTARLLGRALWPEDGWLALRYGIVTPSVQWRHLFAALRGQV
jgi:hypothetical protein